MCHCPNFRSLHAPYLFFLLNTAFCLLPTAALAGGIPDPRASDLRLWLKADAGIKDSSGHAAADPNFQGNVGLWSDQSNHHFDLAAKVEHSPYYIAHQPAVGNHPTVAFGEGRFLARLKDNLHEHAQATMFLVMQLQRHGDQERTVFVAGEMNHKHESLNLEDAAEADTSQIFLRWFCPGSHDDLYVDDNVHMPADGRFVIVTLRSAGENSAVEVQDACGDSLGVERELMGRGRIPASNQATGGFMLGAAYQGQPQSSYDGQIAEVMVFNRALSLDECRAVNGYLRRKYQLDTLDALMPGDTYLLQAEDFDGPWELRSRQYPWTSASLGNRVVAAFGKPAADGIKRSVAIRRAGAYGVWVRALQSGDQNSALETEVHGKGLGLTHNRKPPGMVWQLSGTLDLPAGDSEVVVRGHGFGQKLCDAVMICPAATTAGDVERICATAQRLRQAPSPGQLAAVFEDGRRIEGNFVAGFHGSGATIASDSSPRPSLRSLVVAGPAGKTEPAAGESLFEFYGGDRIAGTLLGYVPASTEAGKAAPACLQVRPAHALCATNKDPIAIDPAWLKRITFAGAGNNAAATLGLSSPRRPRTVTCVDGRSITFTRLRWTAEGASLLTSDGIIHVPYRDMAQVEMEPLDPWEAYYRQLAALFSELRDKPDWTGKIVCIETPDAVVTTSSSRIGTFALPGEAAVSCTSLRPAWSFTPVPIDWSTVVLKQWESPPNIVPLTRFMPERVVQGGPLGASFSWQLDRSASGSELLAGGQRYLWGFGVHAANTMVFRLPDSPPGIVTAFQSSVGIDDSVGQYGCSVARVYLNETGAKPVFRSRPLLGMQPAQATGNIALFSAGKPAQRLILTVEPARDAQSASPAGLDIGDHVDWLEPTLVLDVAKLRAHLK